VYFVCLYIHPSIFLLILSCICVIQMTCFIINIYWDKGLLWKVLWKLLGVFACNLNAHQCTASWTASIIHCAQMFLQVTGRHSEELLIMVTFILEVQFSLQTQWSHIDWGKWFASYPGSFSLGERTTGTGTDIFM
jgi:hypothetical protein